MAKEPESPLGPPPRKARLRHPIRNLRQGYRLLLTLLIFVFAGWAVLDGLRLHELTWHTVRTTGAITRKVIAPKSTPRGQLDYRLEYTFTTEDGTLIADVASVSPEIYEKARETCEVVYLPGNAEADHWLFDNESARTFPRFMMISRGLAALLALGVLLLIERPLRLELDLARNGVVVSGQILATGKGRRKRSKPWIKYTFATATGMRIEGKCSLPRIIQEPERSPGTLIEVLHAPQDPRRNKARLAMTSVEFGK